MTHRHAKCPCYDDFLGVCTNYNLPVELIAWCDNLPPTEGQEKWTTAYIPEDALLGKTLDGRPIYDIHKVRRWICGKYKNSPDTTDAYYRAILTVRDVMRAAAKEKDRPVFVEVRRDFE